LALALCTSLLILAFGAPVSAQDATEEATAAAELTPWECPSGFEGQSLNVYNWSTYIAEDTVANFEAACGVTVSYDVFESNEALFSRLREGNPGYDIIVPTDYMVEIMIQEGLLEPLDLSKIPNAANVSENLQNPPYDPGNQYSLPYQWGTVGIGYNRTVVGEDITSWQQMLDYQGSVAWLEDQRAMINIGLITLGYEPNTADVNQVAEARDNLMNHGSNVVAIAADDGQALLERGDADIVVEYSGDIFQVIDACGCDDYAYVIPEEGANLWTDNLAIPKDAPNVELAHVFINYILDPQVSADIANYTAYGSPNQTAIDSGLIDQELLDNPAIYPSEEILSNLFFNTTLTPEAEQAYLDAWDEIKIRLGQ
jgi:spermidine/putrescine transport system substrate-binding protein